MRGLEMPILWAWRILFAASWLLMRLHLGFFRWIGMKKMVDLFELRRRSSGAHQAQVQAKPFRIWIHGASGELESARPLMRQLKSQFPELEFVVTSFSPSALALSSRFTEASVFELCPWDFPWSWQKFLQKYQPTWAIFSRGDLWPEALHQLRLQGVKTFLIAYHPLSLSWWKTYLLRQISHIWVVETRDQDLLKKNGLNSEVGGDPRFQVVLDRLQSSKLKLRSEDVPTWILGSTWPEDEENLRISIAWWLQQGGRIIWAPHEISTPPPPPFQRWSESSLGKQWFEPILWVDQVGVLAELYAWADLAFVGGSFRSRIHSVMEASAAGCPVVAGPFFENNSEALELREILTPHGFRGFTCVQNPTEMLNFVQSFWHQRKSLGTGTYSEDRSCLREFIQRKARASEKLLHFLASGVTKSR